MILGVYSLVTAGPSRVQGVAWGEGLGTIASQTLDEAMKRGYVAAYRWLGSADASKDACQEAARRALAAADRYDPSRPFYPWFYRILKNLCMDRLKRRARTQPLEHEISVPAVASGSLEAQQREAAVNRAIASLAPEHAEVIELRHFQDLSYEEMAGILDCPTGTVMSRLYRARRRLRELLEQDGGLQ